MVLYTVNNKRVSMHIVISETVFRRVVKTLGK